MDLETMIARALEQRRQNEEKYAAQQERERQETMRMLAEMFCEAFGTGLAGLLDAQPQAIDGDGAWMVFTFRNRPYRAIKTPHNWKIVRMDPRSNDDYRSRPEHFVYHRGNDNAASDLLLALADLDASPEKPPLFRSEPEPPEEAPSDRLLSALREFLQSEI